MTSSPLAHLVATAEDELPTESIEQIPQLDRHALTQPPSIPPQHSRDLYNPNTDPDDPPVGTNNTPPACTQPTVIVETGIRWYYDRSALTMLSLIVCSLMVIINLILILNQPTPVQALITLLCAVIIELTLFIPISLSWSHVAENARARAITRSAKEHWGLTVTNMHTVHGTTVVTVLDPENGVTSQHILNVINEELMYLGEQINTQTEEN